MSSMKSSDFIEHYVTGHGFKITQIGLNELQRDEDESRLKKLGFKECPICSNKLCSTQLLLEHLRTKHPKTKAFSCNICQRRSLRGSERFLLHIEQCHGNSNVMFQEDRKLPYIKQSSAEEGTNVCDKAGILYCESHGVCFSTNQEAHAHRSFAGTIAKPCFIILMRGIVGSSEEIDLPEETENYMKTRQEGRYTKRTKRVKHTRDSNGSPTIDDVTIQSSPEPRTIIYQEGWSKYPRNEHWEHQIKKENLVQPGVSLPVIEHSYSNAHLPYSAPQDAMYPTNYPSY